MHSNREERRSAAKQLPCESDRCGNKKLHIAIARTILLLFCRCDELAQPCSIEILHDSGARMRAHHLAIAAFIIIVVYQYVPSACMPSATTTEYVHRTGRIRHRHNLGREARRQCTVSSCVLCVYCLAGEPRGYARAFCFVNVSMMPSPTTCVRCFRNI
jgi:hypothetical protein